MIVDPHDNLSAVGSVRALGIAGWEVGVAWAGSRTSSAVSRYAVRDHRIAPIEEGVEGFVASVARAAHGYGIVFPTDDAGLLALSEHRDRLSALYPYAPHDVVIRALDKIALAEVTRGAGLAYPRIEAADASSLAGWEGPVVLKSALHWDPRSPSDMPRLDPRFFSSADDEGLSDRIGFLEDHGARPILQEHVVGRLMALSIVRSRDGTTLAAVQQETVGPWPTPPGISLRARSTDVDARLLESVERLLAELGWIGLAELQFIRPREGAPMLIDLNGRFYGSLPLATASGVNLADLWGRDALGMSVSPKRGRSGARYHWLLGDLKASWEIGGLKRWIELVRTFTWALGATSSLLSWRDPRPMLHWITASLKRKLARWRR